MSSLLSSRHLALAAACAAGLTGCPVILNSEQQARVDADSDGYDILGYGDGNDCDDTNAAVHPGATEICGDGLDDDCDGTANNCGLSGTLTPGSADLSIEPLGAKEKLGGAVANVGDIDGDGTEDVLVGAPGTKYSYDNAGAAYLMLGPPPNGSQLLVSQADLKIYGASDAEQTGGVLAGAGDMDGDGFGEMLLGTPLRASSGNDKVGAWFLIQGPGGPARSTAAADGTAIGGSTNDRLGNAVAAGDLTGSADRDVVAGAPFADQSGSNDGLIYVWAGPVQGNKTTAKADISLYGSSGDTAGTALAVGDLDGDGTDDLLIGAPLSDLDGTDAGTAFVMHGPLSAEGLLKTGADGRLSGMAAGDNAGASVCIGDLDGDGYNDAVVGAPLAEGVVAGTGAALVMLGPINGNNPAVGGAMGQDAGDGAGTAVAIGDADGDGIDDLEVGAPNRDVTATDNGAVYLLYGPVDARIALGRAQVKIAGEADADALGAALALADWDGNGSADLFLGSATQDGTANNGGVVYVFLVAGL